MDVTGSSLQERFSHIAFLTSLEGAGVEKQNMSQQVANDLAIGAAKAAPALGVIATGATGAINWSDVAYGLTAAYMLLQIVLLIPKYRTMFKEWRKP